MYFLLMFYAYSNSMLLKVIISPAVNNIINAHFFNETTKPIFETYNTDKS